MLVQAQAAAADILLSEAEMMLLGSHNDLDPIRQPPLSCLLQHADNCLFSLDSLQQSMFAFPSHALGQTTLSDLRLRRSNFGP